MGKGKKLSIGRKQKNVRAETIWTKLKKKRKTFLLRDLEMKEPSQPLLGVISSSGEKQAQLQGLPIPKRLKSNTSVAL